MSGRELLEYVSDESHSIRANGTLFRSCGGIRKHSTGLINRHAVLSATHNFIEVGDSLPARNSTNKSPEALRFANIAFPNGLNYDDKYVMNFVIEIMCSHPTV